MGLRNWIRQFRRRWNMPLDEELVEAVLQADRDMQQETVSPRFAFWVIFLVIGFFVAGIVLTWNG